ncbi:hypothetical protein HPB47_025391 [Ixodes persulcatus]|uniref:Uncharacterized protein n=1 Tax=Ixodes persulcatus TaxID=34615 RepID=A0AC60Q229_IXOPE|nr:hypothetical protein HPB47_025391 [Ixodes persulcatus]
MMRRMNLVRREATRTARNVPTDFEEVKSEFLARVEDVVHENEIPKDTTLGPNWLEASAGQAANGTGCQRQREPELHRWLIVCVNTGLQDRKSVADYLEELGAYARASGALETCVLPWIDPLVFQCGQTSLDDEERSGRPSLTDEPQIAAQVEALILVDRQIALEEIAQQVSVSLGSVHNILHNNLLLIPTQKDLRKEVAAEMLQLSESDPDNIKQNRFRYLAHREPQWRRSLASGAERLRRLIFATPARRSPFRGRKKNQRSGDCGGGAETMAGTVGLGALVLLYHCMVLRITTGNTSYSRGSRAPVFRHIKAALPIRTFRVAGPPRSGPEPLGNLAGSRRPTVPSAGPRETLRPIASRPKRHVEPPAVPDGSEDWRLCTPCEIPILRSPDSVRQTDLT